MQAIFEQLGGVAGFEQLDVQPRVVKDMLVDVASQPDEIMDPARFFVDQPMEGVMLPAELNAKIFSDTGRLSLDEFFTREHIGRLLTGTMIALGPLPEGIRTPHGQKMARGLLRLDWQLFSEFEDYIESQNPLIGMIAREITNRSNSLLHPDRLVGELRTSAFHRLNQEEHELVSQFVSTQNPSELPASIKQDMSLLGSLMQGELEDEAEDLQLSRLAHIIESGHRLVQESVTAGGARLALLEGLRRSLENGDQSLYQNVIHSNYLMKEEAIAYPANLLEQEDFVFDLPEDPEVEGSGAGLLPEFNGLCNEEEMRVDATLRKSFFGLGVRDLGALSPADPMHRSEALRMYEAIASTTHRY